MYSLADFDLVFSIQSTEFIKSVNFGSKLEKKYIKKHENFNFSPTN